MKKLSVYLAKKIVENKFRVFRILILFAILFLITINLMFAILIDKAFDSTSLTILATCLILYTTISNSIKIVKILLKQVSLEIKNITEIENITEIKDIDLSKI